MGRLPGGVSGRTAESDPRRRPESAGGPSSARVSGLLSGLGRGSVFPSALLVFLVALLARGFYLWDAADNPTFRVPILDAMTYDLTARSLAHGEPLTASVFWQPPFYPAFLAALYKIGGSSIVFARIVQAILGAVTCMLTCALGRRLFGPRIGLAAGLLAAVYGPLFFFDGELLAAGWAAFFSVALILLFLQTSATRRPATAFMLGAAAAFSILTRPEFILFLTAGFTWLIGSARPHRPPGWRPLLLPAIALLLGFLVPALPAALMNHRVTGHFGLLPSSGGVNLYLGNIPNVDETVNARPGAAWSDIMDLPQRRGVYAPEMAARQQVYLREVTGYLGSQPLEFVRGLGRKAVQLVSSREIPRNEDIYLYRRWSILLRALVWKAGPFGFPLGVVLPFAMVALIFRARRFPTIVWLYLGGFALSIVTVFVTDRYRAPMIPVLLIAAAVGAGTVVHWLRGRDWKRLSAAAGCLAATALLATLPGPFVAERMNYEPEMHDGIGRTLGRYGRFPEAVASLRRAIEIDGTYADAHANLAYMLERTGKLDEAKQEYEIALGLNPAMAHASEGLGRLQAAQNEPEKAIATWREGLAIRPFHTSMRTSLAETLLGLGRTEEGMRECREVLEYDPGHALALYLLGTEHARRSEYAEAESWLLRAAGASERGPRRVSPGDIHFALAKIYRLQQKRAEAIDRYAQAVRAYRRDLDADPQNASVRNSMKAALEERQTHFGR